ncbi:uncharacterized protein LOC126661382 [Mercurialis annua]|uniref:uncharacterized protein LOC126661382 n=1 Tax=Mercurialis annua TaxID=3986 RepID=UPI00215DF8B3|nr:uncharacterized protein LOC126661382 [Mercurialis annua]
MEITNKMNGSSFFQMPVHYPRFTKKDYENMPEWQVDRLLAEYGLPTIGDLDHKREFAKGAFLWPDEDSSFTSFNDQESSPCPSSDYGFSCSYKKFKIVSFLFRVLGHS